MPILFLMPLSNSTHKRSYSIAQLLCQIVRADAVTAQKAFVLASTGTQGFGIRCKSGDILQLPGMQ